MGSSAASQQTAEKGSTENKRSAFLIIYSNATEKTSFLVIIFPILIILNPIMYRHCLRRQSASPRMQQQEPAKRVSEFEDIARQYDSLARAQEEDLAPPLEHKSCCSKRTSLGRPLRRAAGRVQSYKQVPLNVKMRRSD